MVVNRVGGARPQVRLTLNGKGILVSRDRTLLDICREQGIDVPTLCDDPQLKPHSSCGICVVEIEGYGLVNSCSSLPSDGMVVQTWSHQVVSARKERLEALLHDHYGDCNAPCQRACPAGIDIQGYLALIARGAYSESVALIKERLPLPGVIGRICPHPCEQACRRNLVDKPLAICSSKRFAADMDRQSEHRFVPQLEPKTGKRVAVVGAGPAGLSAAYYLSVRGHQVDIFEGLPKAGGMLRYGIPDYRLPQDLLDSEVASVAELGATITTGRWLGRDFTIQGLKDEGYDAVLLAIGAQKSTSMGVEGEDLVGVYQGIQFLQSVAAGRHVEVGKKIVVIGGGNTAIDAARTGVRLGLDEVTLVYRRSRAEMPASDWEIDEAEEEGVDLHFLAAPVRILGSEGRVTGIECIQMVLGAPDASGRCRPEPVPGSEFVIPADAVVAAIGQHPDSSYLRDEPSVRTERNGTIAVELETMGTDMAGVYAAGDCVSGAVTAVEGIAGGRKAALSIHAYLTGQARPEVDHRFDISRGKLEQLSGRPEFTRLDRKSRARMPKIALRERLAGFQEMELGFTEEAAQQEARRCLECGCKADYYCVLRELATEYDVQAPGFRSDRTIYPMDKSHPFIERDANKCIACARCARICATVQGVAALGFSYRVATHEGNGGSLLNTTCESCGQCVASCPVGALVAKNELSPDREVKTVCPYCGVGCGIYLGVRGDRIVSLRGTARARSTTATSASRAASATTSSTLPTG